MTAAPRPLSETEIAELGAVTTGTDPAMHEVWCRLVAELRDLRAVADAARYLAAAIKADCESIHPSRIPDVWRNEANVRELALIDALAALDATGTENSDAG